MKRISLILLSLLLVSCGNNNSNKSSVKNDETSNNSATRQETNVAKENEFAGTYEYVYPHNTSDLIENHYIILWRDQDNYLGLYYGTSDEFDENREGYLPGFFVAQMENLRIVGDSISFRLSIKNEDIFDKSVELKYKSADEARQNGYMTWPNIMKVDPKNYKGTINNKSITLYGQIDNKEFKLK